MAKEEEKAAKEAEKAAEEAKAKAMQAALDEENRKKREEERQRREAAKRAADEEKARKEEDKRKRQQEEKDRELERERKKKEKEERVKKEREARERKAKEERARQAKEREEKAEKERLEKEERLNREKEEKEAKEKERIAAQRAASAKNPVRLNATASSSSSSLSTSKSNPPPAVSPPALHRTPNTSAGSTVNGTPKKAGSSKQAVSAPGGAPPGVVGQLARSLSQPGQGSQPPQQPPNLPRPLPPINVPSHLPPQQPTVMYGHPPQAPVMIPPAMSPRVGSFPPIQYPYGNHNMQHPPGTPITQPTIPQSFNAGPSFDPAASFTRSMSIPPIGIPLTRGGSGGLTPIGPPKPKTPLTVTSSAPSMLAPGSNRRSSAVLNPDSAAVASTSSPVVGSGPGPITRPLAPIARPMTGNAATSGDGTTSSGSGSPNRRSPSPKGVLGSSALAADDDEVVMTGPTRRVGNAGHIGIGVSLAPVQTWGPASPRGPGAISPWVTPGGSNFSPSAVRTAAPIGSNNGLHVPPVGPSGITPSIGTESLWASTPSTLNDAWHPQNATGFFHAAGQQFAVNHSNASSAPHASS